MSRVARHRVRAYPYPQGSVQRFFSNVGAAPNTNTGNIFQETCDDSVGRPVVASSFNLVKLDRYSPDYYNGISNPGPNRVEVNNYASLRCRGNALPDLSISGIPAASTQVATLLARTNPSRPGVTPLTLLQDLKDIPKQLRDVGNLIKNPKSALNPKQVANQYLGAQFGWLPLFRDVQDLLDVQHSIHKRIGELERLYSGKGLKRRLHLGEWSEHSDSVQVMNTSSSFQPSARESIDTYVTRWGTVRWKPSGFTLKHRPSDADIISQAKRVALGLTVEGTLKGAWDLIPWTWLIGWFTNVSDFALQYSNTVPATPHDPCIMTQTITSYRWVPTSVPVGVTGGYGGFTRTTKNRYAGSGSLNVTLPFIGNDRLSILGALFVQRFK